ncbi:uncharacterized protein BX664DRAFT_268302, partial [Halteromyces radiatus]|uniref:uncharacterized protein n=1 Tax=Halteromyces radiatus TaxID=101107 RepID=UPI002220E750
RYSEFESFRTLLTKLYPAIFVPPIPGKHSLSDYAHVHTQSRHKDELAMVEKRKRMLERFLCRLMEHPILSREHAFHQFLQPNVSWNEVLTSPPFVSIKDPLLESISSSVPGETTFVSSLLGGNVSSQIIPIPTISYAVKNPDPKYLSSESLLDKQSQHASTRLDRSQKKLLRRLGDLSNDYADMGAAYNALSLDEVGEMANTMEQLGLSNDEVCLQMRKLVTQLEIEFAEHIQEYVQYTMIAKQSIRYWYMKQAQLEMIGDALVNKQTALYSLLKTEDQAERLQTLMTQGNSSSPDDDGFFSVDSPSPSGPSTDNNNDHDEILQQNNNNENNKHTSSYPSAASISAIRASKSKSKKWTSPRKLFNAMTYTIQGMMDVDPEQTRRNQIKTLKATIAELENAKMKISEEVKQVGISIQEELRRFEEQKMIELRTMMIAFAKRHLEFCEKNMISWQQTRQQVSDMGISD